MKLLKIGIGFSAVHSPNLGVLCAFVVNFRLTIRRTDCAGALRRLSSSAHVPGK
jgi:hypothetical protein